MREMLAPYVPVVAHVQALPAAQPDSDTADTIMSNANRKPVKSTSVLATQCSCTGCTQHSAHVVLPCCHQMCGACLERALAKSAVSDAAVQAYEAEQFGPAAGKGVEAPEGRQYLTVCPVCSANGMPVLPQQLLQSVTLVVPK